tara:strand:+ start:158 stop:484 length:327 start_codon:yes stop_codon:yes gene_type:complete
MVIEKKSSTHEVDHALKHEADFKVEARRNRLLGLWAAERLRLSGEEAEAYAKEVVVSDLDEPGEEDVVRKVKGDFDKRGVSLDEGELRHMMKELRAVARQQVESEDDE